jgi:hypothetical protein
LEVNGCIQIGKSAQTLGIELQTDLGTSRNHNVFVAEQRLDLQRRHVIVHRRLDDGNVGLGRGGNVPRLTVDVEILDVLSEPRERL